MEEKDNISPAEMEKRLAAFGFDLLGMFHGDPHRRPVKLIDARSSED